MADTASHAANSVVLGEFCEMQGPVVRQLLCFNTEHGVPDTLDSDRWSASLKAALEELMSLSMTTDYTILDEAKDLSFGAVTRFILNDILWFGRTSAVYVTRISLSDVLARGHQRNICLAFVCTTPHTLISLSKWVGDYSAAIVRHLAKGAHISYRKDVQQRQMELSVLLAAANTESVLPEQTVQLLHQEMLMLKHLSKSDEGPASDTSSSFAGGVVMSFAEVVGLAEKLIFHRGTVPLRLLRDVCGPHFDESIDDMKRLLWYFSLDTPWLMEGALGTMPSSFSLFHRSFADSIRCQEIQGNWEAMSHSFKVGELDIINPLLPYTFLSLTNCSAASTRFTALNDPGLYTMLRGYGIHHVMDVAYNGLRCKPIIVCGHDEGGVVAAMKVACIFVPGLLQGQRDALRLGIQPLTCMQHLSAADIHRFAVVGCHVSAACVNGVPLFPQACTWHVGLQTKGHGYCTLKLYAERYNASFAMARDQTTSLTLSTDDPEEGGGGLLLELGHMLSQSVRNSEHEVALSDHLRVLLKRVLLNYCSIASLVVQSLLNRSRSCNSTDFTSQPISPQPLAINASRQCGNVWPWVWTERDTEVTLRSCFGISLTFRNDITIVKEIMKRMCVVVGHACLPLL